MVVAKEKMMSYEEIRQKRVEENKKRMEALNLPQLSTLLHTPSFKPSPRKQMKPRTVEKQLVVVRRSSRVANKPAPVYQEGLPVHFCKTNLPKRDEVMTLVDEEGHEYPTIYLAKKTGLSGGWKGFAVAHGLVDGDAIVFQLLQRTTFKVYIIRVKGSQQS
ncbi:hypothetical protein V6Z11_A01G128100 [Gossypium hirsutum]